MAIHAAMVDRMDQEIGRVIEQLKNMGQFENTLIMFTEHAKNACVVERALHGSFFSEWALSPQAVYATPMAPNGVLYTSYLLRVAYERPFHEGLGAFLACYWIYAKVGRELEAQGSPVAIYQRWIDTYAGEAYAAVVAQVLDLVNTVAAGLTPAQQASMAEHLVMTSRFEYMFWDMGYRRQAWEV